MNWKTRQMFSDREHGIVSGLSPINMTGGGNVPYPSYQDGGDVLPQLSNNYHTHPELHSHSTDRSSGLLPLPRGRPRPEDIVLFGQEGMQGGGTVPAQEPSIEQQVAELATKMGISSVEARAMILRRMIQAKGVTLSDEVINQFATGLITLHDALAQAMGPPKMQAGTGLEEAMSIDLFQQGDEEINEPLNMMAQATNPSIADITPTETVGEAVDEETALMDQGPSDTENSKSSFRKLAIQVVVDANKLLIQEDYMNIEEVEQQVKENLTIIDEQYRLQIGADDTILTPEFLDQLDQMMRNPGDEFDAIPGMKEGTDEKTAAVWDLIAGLQGKGVAPAKIEEIIKKYYNPEEASEALKMLKDRQQIARRSALLGGKTKQSGLSGMMDILGQADAAEVAAIGSMPETLATNEAALKRLAMSGELETSGAVSSKMPVDVQKMLITQNLWEDTTMESGLRTVLLEAVAGIETQEAAMQEFKNKLVDNLLGQDWSDLRNNELKGYREKHPHLSPQELIIIFAEDMTNLSFGIVKRKG